MNGAHARSDTNPVLFLSHGTFFSLTLKSNMDTTNDVMCHKKYYEIYFTKAAVRRPTKLKGAMKSKLQTHKTKVKLIPKKSLSTCFKHCYIHSTSTCLTHLVKVKLHCRTRLTHTLNHSTSSFQQPLNCVNFRTIITVCPCDLNGPRCFTIHYI